MRGLSRALFYDPATRQRFGEILVDYGAPVWKADYGDLDAFRGQRLRLGAGEWASLTCEVPMTIGDTPVAEGRYLLALDCSAAGVWSLVLLDAARVERDDLPPWDPARTKALGVTIELTQQTAASPSPRLAVRIEGSDPKAMLLSLTFGPHQLVVPLAERIPRSGSPDAAGGSPVRRGGG